MMQVILRIVGILIGLGLTGILGYAAIYIAEEIERTSFWPVGRFIKALVGGIIWAVQGALVAAVLFAIAIIVRAIFFRPLFSFYILQLWAFNISIVLVALYFIWGAYYGARSQLLNSYKYRRQ